MPEIVFIRLHHVNTPLHPEAPDRPNKVIFFFFNIFALFCIANRKSVLTGAYTASLSPQRPVYTTSVSG